MKAAQKSAKQAPKSTSKFAPKVAARATAQKRLAEAQDCLLWIAALEEEDMVAIFEAVSRAKFGKVGHSAFLTAFAQAYLCADGANRQLMHGVALAVIGKYGLNPMWPAEFNVEEWRESLANCPKTQLTRETDPLLGLLQAVTSQNREPK